MIKNKKTNNGILVKTCVRCKKIISQNSLYNYCPECFKRIEDIFEKIETYLREYPGATAFEIEQETGVPYHVINNFVRDGRLIEIPNEYLNFECKRCGRLLLSAHHKHCPVCRKKLENEMELAKMQLYNSMNHGNAKMHFKRGEDRRKKY
ncbi:MAG: hypothetical protein N4A57_05740 [Anaeromicrobium sp.]|jgi:Zn finger protein HypA/HybF involved in hydrogenase expression|uniref:hypothetical protein n=1 Tax=Anaeromicrobium sp. TaxID=1929132 RepID=UPI0025F138B9|nr:hypothetical protein [Anaeromicrobium sp.]MCT4593755.1 hypothetical protein [Anaeromicrobium sp.]